jgi:NAD(P)-dependent dehydrogenase (short-subunit alcohol dehydrogenase family)
MNDSGRVVVITGGSMGIGRAVALKFAEEKAKIIVAHYDPNDSASNKTLELLEQRGAEATSHKVDVSN